MASTSKTSIASTNTTSGTVNIDGTLACDARALRREKRRRTLSDKQTGRDEGLFARQQLPLFVSQIRKSLLQSLIV